MSNKAVFFKIVRPKLFVAAIIAQYKELSVFSEMHDSEWIKALIDTPLPIYSEGTPSEFQGTFSDFEKGLDSLFASNNVPASQRCRHYASVIDDNGCERYISTVAKIGLLEMPLLYADTVEVKEARDGFCDQKAYPLCWHTAYASYPTRSACPFLEVPMPNSILNMSKKTLGRMRVVMLTPELLKSGLVLSTSELLGMGHGLELASSNMALNTTSKAKHTSSSQDKSTSHVEKGAIEASKTEVASSTVAEPTKYENPIHVGVAMIPVHSEMGPAWLVIQRAQGDGASMHAFPSGYQEKGERMVECVIRELKEELGEGVFALLEFLGAADESNWTFVGDAVNKKNICLDFYKFNQTLTFKQVQALQKVFTANSEATKLASILASSSTWAFPLHQEKASKA